jgi:hypothetical protein
MRLSRRYEIFLDAEVNLQLTSLEPAAAARGEMRRSCRLRDSENVVVEFAGVALSAGRHGKQDMIQSAIPAPVLILTHRCVT